MTRRFRPFVLALVGFAAAVPLAVAPAAQAPHDGAAGRTKALDRSGRDLAMAAPETVGISSERLRRLDAGMKRLVDEKQVAGLVTLLERHGKVVDLNAFGLRDVRAG